MAVNGIDLAVGQVWKTRDGRQATIASINKEYYGGYSVIAVIDECDQWLYDLDGRFDKGFVSPKDLAHYVCNDEVKADAPGENWIKWDGGDCPVRGYQPVRARLRNGSLAFDKLAVAAGDLAWGHTGYAGDIIEYMVLPIDTPMDNPPLTGFADTTERKTEDGASMFAPGYEKLAAVMAKAYDQAARGKGKERHANSKPFHEQPMLAICRNLGSIDGMLYQATKKAMEARGLPTKDRALAEIYGAINYLCGAAILIEEGIIKGQE